jgi:hypothetical protein
LLIADTLNDDIEHFKQEMRDRFRMSDLSLLSYYLGIEVCQDQIGISLCQSAPTQKILKKTGMAEANPSHTSMEAGLQLVKASSEELVGATEYRSVVGALRYLVHTRPDLSHSMSFVCHFMAEPHQDHMMLVNRILRYVVGTRCHGGQYERGRPGELLLLGYSDSDHVGDIEDSRFMSGSLFYLGGSPISWQSQK